MKPDQKLKWNLGQTTEINKKSLGMSGRLQTGSFHSVDNSKTSKMCGIHPPDAIVMLIFWALESGVAHEVANA